MHASERASEYARKHVQTRAHALLVGAALRGGAAADDHLDVEGAHALLDEPIWHADCEACEICLGIVLLDELARFFQDGGGIVAKARAHLPWLPRAHRFAERFVPWIPEQRTVAVPCRLLAADARVDKLLKEAVRARAVELLCVHFEARFALLLPDRVCDEGAVARPVGARELDERELVHPGRGV
jgi:hypothetical protein